MSDAAEPTPPAGDGKRRADKRRRHTIGKVVLVTLLALTMVTGLTTIYLYRHFNGNLNVTDVANQLGTNRPDKKMVAGPQEPLNILVMGSDDRDAPGNNIDNLTGQGKRSDTTILLHLSADRSRAYGISIPRDSIVNRPSCLDDNGKPISQPETGAMWNDAFSIGGPGCTIRQFEQLTGVPIDHYVVVDFSGFRDMVDAIGGVEVCIPAPIVDPAHGINLPAGTRKLVGYQALNYVRERYVVGNGSDIGRMKRQQAFIASMAHQVVSANTLANPIHLTKFLEAATKSLQLDPGIGSLAKLVNLGYQFRHIGLDKIQFITVPWEVDPSNPNRVVWAPTAKRVWSYIADDKPLAPSMLAGVIKASHVPGTHGTPSGSPSGTPSGSPSGNPTDKPSDSEAAQQAAAEAEANGLCA